MAKLTLRNIRGISLLELMLVLLIIAIILFTSIRYYQVASENLKVAQAVEMVNTISNATAKWLEGQAQLTPDFRVDTLVDAGLLPAYYKTALDPWKGELMVLSGSGALTQLTIVMLQVPKAACENLLARVQKYGVSQNTRCVPGGDGDIFYITIQY